MEEDEEIDPLDAFMAENSNRIAATPAPANTPAPAAGAGAEDSDEEDPLDAFMAAQVGFESKL